MKKLRMLLLVLSMLVGSIAEGSFSQPKNFIKGEIVGFPKVERVKCTFTVEELSNHPELARVVNEIRSKGDELSIEDNPELFMAFDPLNQPAVSFKLPNVTQIEAVYLSSNRTCIINVPAGTVCGYLLVIQPGGNLSTTQIMSIPPELLTLPKSGHLYIKLTFNHIDYNCIILQAQKRSTRALEYAWLKDIGGLYYPGTITDSDTCDTQKTLTFKLPEKTCGTFEFAVAQESCTVGGPLYYHPKMKGILEDLIIASEDFNTFNYKTVIEVDQTAVNKIGDINKIQLETYSGVPITDGFWHTEPDHEKRTMDIMISSDIIGGINLVTTGGPDGKSTGKTQKAGIQQGNSTLTHILSSPSQPGFASEYTFNITRLIDENENVVGKIPLKSFTANFYKSTMFDNASKTLMKEKYNCADVDMYCEGKKNVKTSLFAVNANDESIVYNIGSLQGATIDGPRIKVHEQSTQYADDAIHGLACSIEKDDHNNMNYLVSKTINNQGNTLWLGRFGLPAGEDKTQSMVWTQLSTASIDAAITKIKMRRLTSANHKRSDFYVVCISATDTAAKAFLGKITFPEKGGDPTIDFQDKPFLSTASSKSAAEDFDLNRYTSVAMNRNGNGIITEISQGGNIITHI